MNTKKIKRSEAITRTQDELAYYLNSDNDCTSQPILFDLHYRNLYSSEVLHSEGTESPAPAPPACKKQLETIIADMKLCNNPHDRYLVSLYPSHFEMGNPLQISEATPEKLRQYLVENYGKASADPESFNLSDQIDKVLTLFADRYSLMLKKDLKRKDSRYKGSIYKLVVLNHKLGLINQKWADLVKPQPILLEGKTLPSTIDNHLAFNITNKKKSAENSTIIDAYLTEIGGPTPGNTVQLSEFIKMLPLALQILEDDVKCRTIRLFSSNSNKNVGIGSWLALYKKRLNKTPSKIYTNAHHEVSDHLSTHAQYNLRRNRFIGQYKLLKDIEANSNFQNVIQEIITRKSDINKTESPINAKEEKLADLVARIFSDNGDAVMSTEGKNVAKICARAIAKLGSFKISGYTQGHTSPAYSLRAMLNHITNHYEKSDKKSSAERLGSVPPSTFYLLILLRDAIYWSHSNKVESTTEFFSLQKEIIKNSLKFAEFIRGYKFYNILVLASNIWLDEMNISSRCPCENDNCICALTSYFYSYHGGFQTMLSEHLDRAQNLPSNDPLPKYEELYRQLEDKA
ncbi:hypothetical protein L4D13_18415 [Photobacterium profundum]|uniref:hypothetical protein n=1 Tax=Photobacterium profundum TaxID=74109 RepID=UPI003D0CBC47